jgi:hypothetical protein
MTNSEYREIRLRDGRALTSAEYGSPRGLPILHCHGTPSSRVEGDRAHRGRRGPKPRVRLTYRARPMLLAGAEGGK